MWTVNTLEKSRADVNPVQLNFYGLWPWIIIMNVSQLSFQFCIDARFKLFIYIGFDATRHFLPIPFNGGSM